MHLVWGCANEMLVFWGQFEMQFVCVGNELNVVVGGAYVMTAGWSIGGLVNPLGVGHAPHGHGLLVLGGRHLDPLLDHSWHWVGVAHFVGW